MAATAAVALFFVSGGATSSSPSAAAAAPCFERPSVPIESSHQRRHFRRHSALESSPSVDCSGWKAAGDPSDLPRWARRLFSASEGPVVPLPHAVDGKVMIVTTERHASVVGGGEGDGDDALVWSLRTAVLRGASSLEPADLAMGTREACRALLDGVPRSRLLRAWNFVPRINDAYSDVGGDDGILDMAGAGGSHDRYAAFNAGRYGAFNDVYPSQSSDAGTFPAATGVGHGGNDLVVHLLHGGIQSSVRGSHADPVDNPRQVRPDRYSERFMGTAERRPPAFSRAAIVRGDKSTGRRRGERGRQRGGREDGSRDDVKSKKAAKQGLPLLLVSGTASIVGEETMHAGSLSRQTEETLDNIDAVIAGSAGAMGTATPCDVLVYIDPRVRNRSGTVLRAVQRRYPGLPPGGVAFREVAICRSDLLVEIECAAWPRFN